MAAKKLVAGLLVAIFICAPYVNVEGLDNGVGATPAMGWNSWNYFRCNINETIVQGAADAMVDSGLRDIGYRYVVIDDCWQEKRGAGGVIQPFANKFPSGMKALAEYVHSKGLLFGLYTDAGNHTCEGYPGSWGYEDLDAQTYADWGVDFVKYDYCGMEKSTVSVQDSYTKLRDALNKTGRPIYYSMCSWGHGQPWLWGKQVGHSWRVAADLYAAWDLEQTSAMYLPGFLQPVLVAVDAVSRLAEYAGPGGFNDPDMLVVGLDGMYPYGIVEVCPPHVKGCKPGTYISREQWGRQGGLSFTEQRTHFALWCMLSSPLILGNDPRNMSAATLSILKAEDFLAVNQDPLAQQGTLVWTRGDIQLWRKNLQDGGIALLLFNKGSSNADITVVWEEDLPELHRQWAKKLEVGHIVECADKSEECAAWASDGECEKNPGFMLARCQLSCPGACPQLDWSQKPHSNALVRDLWWREDLGVFWDAFTAEQVEPHEGRMLKVTFVEAGTKLKHKKSYTLGSSAKQQQLPAKKEARASTQQLATAKLQLAAATIQIKKLQRQLQDLQGELQTVAAQQAVAGHSNKGKSGLINRIASNNAIKMISVRPEEQSWEDVPESESERVNESMGESIRGQQDWLPPAGKLRRSGQIQAERTADLTYLQGSAGADSLYPSMNMLLLLCNLMLMAAVAFFGLRMSRIGVTSGIPIRRHFSH